MRFEDLFNRPVVDIVSGERLGIVSDLLLDKASNSLKYLLITTKRLNGKVVCLPQSAVQQVLRAAVLAKVDQAFLSKKLDLCGLVSFCEMRRKNHFQVLQGTFDMETGIISELAVSSGFIRDFLHGKTVYYDVRSLIDNEFQERY